MLETLKYPLTIEWIDFDVSKVWTSKSKNKSTANGRVSETNIEHKIKIRSQKDNHCVILLIQRASRGKPNVLFGNTYACGTR